jgi:hypothetical protein
MGPGTRRIPLVPRDELAETERQLLAARDLLLAVEASLGSGEARGPRQVFVDESLDELRRIGWKLEQVGTPLGALKALAASPRKPMGTGLAALYSGGGLDLFADRGEAPAVLRSAQSEVVRALMVVKVLASYGESARRERGVGFENLSASGADPAALGPGFGRLKSGPSPGR